MGEHTGQTPRDRAAAIIADHVQDAISETRRDMEAFASTYAAEAIGEIDTAGLLADPEETVRLREENERLKTEVERVAFAAWLPDADETPSVWVQAFAFLHEGAYGHLSWDQAKVAVDTLASTKLLRDPEVHAERDALSAECERLRAALERVKNALFSGPDWLARMNALDALRGVRTDGTRPETPPGFRETAPDLNPTAGGSGEPETPPAPKPGDEVEWTLAKQVNRGTVTCFASDGLVAYVIGPDGNPFPVPTPRLRVGRPAEADRPGGED